MNIVESPLPPEQAAKLIKFYLNLYPDLVSTLKDYFPKPVIRKQTTFNRTIKVKIPTDKKSELAVKLAKELSFVSWFFQGYYLMVPYHSEAEWQRLTKDITKIAKSLGVKGLSFKGIKGVIREQKKKASKPMLTTIAFDNATKKLDTLLNKGHLTDSKDKELDKFTDEICEYKVANGISVPDIYGVELAWQLALEYGYSFDKLKAELGEELYKIVALRNRNLTPEHITKLAKLFNLPESVFYPEIKAT